MSEQESPDWLVSAIEPHARYLYKPIENCQSDGCHLDVWIPSHDAALPQGRPIAIFIHGGGFTVGSSKDIGFNQVKWFLKHGIACVSLEYRLLPHVTGRESRNDLLDAYRFIQTKLQSLLEGSLGSIPHLALDRCVVTGGSAGGTCALMLAIDIDSHNTVNDDQLPPLKAVLSGFPLVDANSWPSKPRDFLWETLRSNTEDPGLHDEIKKLWIEKVCVSEPYLDDIFMDPPPRIPRQLFATHAMKNGTLTSFYHIHDPPYPREDSPLTAVTASFPPTWIYCALEDDLIPVSQSFMMADRLRELEVEVHAEGIRAPHGYSDLPMRYFPDRAEGWWRESILPSLKWANSKLQR